VTIGAKRWPLGLDATPCCSLQLKEKYFFNKPAIHSIAAKLFKRHIVKQNEKKLHGTCYPLDLDKLHGNEHLHLL
jgi:hypothetical protein